MQTLNKGLKVYVAVKANFRETEAFILFELTWEDGQRYTIDRVTDIWQTTAMKADGQGDRYTIMINEKYCSVEEVLEQIETPSAETELSQATIDYLIWTFCASKNFEICSTTPHCARCPLSVYCKYPQHSTGMGR